MRPQKPFSAFYVSSVGKAIVPRSAIRTLRIYITKQEHSG
ncbi:hypothetical protein KPSA3_05990 [Pseudomonas syringae pv. actinidiae]|uniref:Uncharacterized protein n=1 Tax=Pseudomonas syringae pv. actinidiae TaxID=103796 RepID=A0AAN4QAG0_PSESF|nr:hypothetical protein KPSA3_05990 [Pseudomonas syringae pv. actinidiae]